MQIYPWNQGEEKVFSLSLQQTKKKKGKEKNSQLVASSYQLHPSQLQVQRKCFLPNSSEPGTEEGWGGWAVHRLRWWAVFTAELPTTLAEGLWRLHGVRFLSPPNPTAVFFLSQVLIPNKHVTSQITSPSLFLENPTAPGGLDSLPLCTQC